MMTYRQMNYSGTGDAQAAQSERETAFNKAWCVFGLALDEVRMGRKMGSRQRRAEARNRISRFVLRLEELGRSGEEVRGFVDAVVPCLRRRLARLSELA